MILIKGKSLLTSDRLAWNNTGLYDHHLCSIRAFFRKNCTVHIAGATARVRQEGPGSSDDKSFSGFFGSCRALVGIQSPISERFRLGSEAVFTFLNYMMLESGDLSDNSFQFPNMKWNFTVRYSLF